MKSSTKNRLRILAVGAAIAAATVAIYYTCLHYPFAFDDQPYLVENPYLRHLGSPIEILVHNTRPVVIYTFAANFALGRLNPWNYHLTNVLIQLLSALLLYAVVRRSMESERLGWKRASWASRTKSGD